MQNRHLTATFLLSWIVGVPGCKSAGSMEGTGLLAASNSGDLAGMVRANRFVGPGTAYEDLAADGGGCGPTEALIKKETGGRLNFAALNVLNTPGDYSHRIPRPIPADQMGAAGLFQNGQNCGRWVRVEIPWEGTIKSADFIVTDSCHDGNEWCRNFPGHIDLSIFEIARSVAGVPFSEADRSAKGGWPFNWPNPEVTWKFIDAPNYKGPVHIHFAQNSQVYWPAIIISNLPRGISKLYNKVDGSWKEATRDSDRGQVFVLEQSPTQSWEIKFDDAYGQSDGNIFRIQFPAACGSKCTAVTTPATIEAI